jgi:hypothetical protein
MRLVVERRTREEGSVRTLFSVVMVVAVLASVLSLGAFSQPVQADGIVTGQVTLVEEVVISVSIPSGYPESVSYGSMLLGQDSGPWSYGDQPVVDGFLRVVNDGNVVEDLLISGSDAVKTPLIEYWTLSASPGTDAYCHLFGLGEEPTTYTPLSYAPATLGDNVTEAGTVDFNLWIQMPTDSTAVGGGGYTMTVTITAIAA